MRVAALSSRAVARRVKGRSVGGLFRGFSKFSLRSGQIYFVGGLSGLGGGARGLVLALSFSSPVRDCCSRLRFWVFVIYLGGGCELLPADICVGRYGLFLLLEGDSVKSMLISELSLLVGVGCGVLTKRVGPGGCGGLIFHSPIRIRAVF
ncbi:hypothetical protein DY000_02014673 [Brassica cretica]|uniref:Uncharacterized protein n=1 Tax=Brassica cretica TaxID=69181 RepID=A0ABQ7CMG7_BRACR|nr:hypothetical protein DY000_02014673 [Brassica cretica]